MALIKFTLLLKMNQSDELGYLHPQKNNLISDYQYIISPDLANAALWDTQKQANLFNNAFLEGKGILQEVQILTPDTVSDTANN